MQISLCRDNYQVMYQVIRSNDYPPSIMVNPNASRIHRGTCLTTANRLRAAHRTAELASAALNLQEATQQISKLQRVGVTPAHTPLPKLEMPSPRGLESGQSKAPSFDLLPPPNHPMSSQCIATYRPALVLVVGCISA